MLGREGIVIHSLDDELVMRTRLVYKQTVGTRSPKD